MALAASKSVIQAALPWYLRIALVAIGAGLAVALGIAVCLTPDPDGLGTHEQMGLSPCTFRVLFHMRCPSCGMTTSWAHLMRGQGISAVRANAGGALLGLLALAVVPWSLLSGLRGRWTAYEPGYLAPPCLAALVVLVTLIQWGVRLWLG